MKTRLEQLARPVIGLALFGGFVLAFSGWAGVYAERERMQQDARKSGIHLLERAAVSARELGHFPDRVDAFLGVLGILAIKAMKSSPEDINDLLRELGRLAK